LAIIPFLIGVLMLAYYYLIWRPRHKNAVETM
jgi:preprotein translocase subunit YajC